MIQIIWEYKVKPEKRAEFEKAYGREGQWVQFFKKSKAYKKTELVVKDLENLHYMTIDTWKSLEKYEDFFKNNLKEFSKLNKQFEKFIIEENEIGIFSEE